MKSKLFFCVAATTELIGYARADTADEAVLECDRIWGEFHETDHVHEDHPEFKTEDCPHCQVLWGKQVKH